MFTAKGYRTFNGLLLLVLLGLPLVGLFTLAVGRWTGHPLTTCGSVVWLNRPCPLCGLTRAADALLHGRLAEAQRWHMAVLPFALVYGAEVLARLVLWLRATPAPEILLRRQHLDRLVHLAMGLAYLLYTALFYLAPG